MSREVEESLLALEARLDAARMSGDVGLFEEILGDEFRTTNPVGALSDRDETLAATRSGTMKVSYSKSTGITVTAFGDMAIVRGKATMKATYQGHRIDGVYPYTHVYLRRGGRWQVVAAHTSRRMPDWLFMVVNRFVTFFHLTPE